MVCEVLRVARCPERVAIEPGEEEGFRIEGNELRMRLQKIRKPPWRLPEVLVIRA
jgi:hypothetical protein